MRTVQRVIIAVLLLAPIAIAVPVYVGLVADGSVSAPDVEAVVHSLMPFATGALATAAGIAIVTLVSFAAIAPIIYAARSGDLLTVLISLVLTTTALGLFAMSKTVVHEVLAVLIYMANIILSSAVYVAHHIVESRQQHPA